LPKRRLHIALFLFIDSAATMSQLHASSKSSMLSPYFAKPSSSYEKFVNKKWAERNDIFETKKKFIKRTIQQWKTLDQIQRAEYLTAPVQERPRNNIKSFFKAVPKPKPIETSSSNLSESNSSKPNNGTQTTSLLNPQPFTSNSPSVSSQVFTSNSHSALENREQFLSSKEDLLIKEFLIDIGFQGRFEDVCFKDPQFRQAISKLSYDWKEFTYLREK